MIVLQPVSYLRKCSFTSLTGLYDLLMEVCQPGSSLFCGTREQCSTQLAEADTVTVLDCVFHNDENANP